MSNHDPRVTMTYFKSRSIWSPTRLNGEIAEMPGNLAGIRQMYSSYEIIKKQNGIPFN